MTVKYYRSTCFTIELYDSKSTYLLHSNEIELVVKHKLSNKSLGCIINEQAFSTRQITIELCLSNLVL